MCEIWPRFQRQSTLSRPHLKMQQDVRTLKQTSCVGMITIVLATFGEVGSTPPPPDHRILSRGLLNFAQILYRV